MHPSPFHRTLLFFPTGGKCSEIFSKFNNAGLYRVGIKYALARTSPGATVLNFDVPSKGEGEGEGSYFSFSRGRFNDSKFAKENYGG